MKHLSFRIHKQFFFFAIICLSSILMAQQNFDGIWQSEGYGEIFDISGNNVDNYQVTEISNIFMESLNLIGNQLGNGEDLIGCLSAEGDHLLLTLTGGTVVVLNSLDQLPELTVATNDPQLNFDIFWQTYQDWCALFPILDVDWQEQYNTYNALIDANTSDDDLFNYMAQMLSTLNDGHSYLDDEDDDDRYFEGGPMISDLWYEYDYDMMDMIEEQYIDGGGYVFSGSEQISYGTINDSIGYLAVNGMDDYSENGNELDDNAIFASEIDHALSFLQNTKALIIDIRFNLGGFDSNSRILANRLATISQEVYSKQARTGSYYEFGFKTTFSVQPEGVQYLGRPVVVMTSGATLSAADIFAVISKELDCVTLIGETTYGILSDNYIKYLPNGWEFSFSPERYLDNNATNYEQLGIPPDIEIIGSMTDFNNNIDNILEVAIDEIFGLCAITETSTLESTKSTKISPNPVSMQLSIELDLDLTSVVKISISDPVGRIVFDTKEKRLPGSNLMTVDVNNLAQGTYFLSIKAGNQTDVKRFCVLR